MSADTPAVLTFNFTNWITVLIMVLIGFSVIRLIFKWKEQKTANA